MDRDDWVEQIRQEAKDYWAAKPGFPPIMITALSDAEARARTHSHAEQLSK